MPPLWLILVLFNKVYGLLGKNIVQPDALVRAQLGDTVTLPCFNPTKEVTHFNWLKQPLGLKPRFVAMESIYNDEFKNSEHISVKAEKGSCNLTVSQVVPSDSATYYCAIVHGYEISVGDGTILMVMGSKSNSRAVVLQQPVSESVQPGDSVTLQCTVLTETCAGEHTVSWFRQGSGESPPGIIYTHGSRSDECQRSSGAVSPTQSCVYNFPKRNLSLSDAGTYYCALDICGEILFGNGTKLDFEYQLKTNEALPLYCLAAAFMLSVILNIVLALKRRKGSEDDKGAAASISEVTREDLTSEQCPDETMTTVTFTTKKPKEEQDGSGERNCLLRHEI